MELSDREYEIVADVWGSDTPADLTAVDQETLIAMHSRFSEAILDAATDRDETALEILAPLERKVLSVLQERVTNDT